MTTESERRERLRPTFKDGDISAELDNPLALGLIELKETKKFSMAILGRRDSTETDFCIAPIGDKTLSTEEFTDFTEKFTEDFLNFTEVEHVAVRQIRSGKSIEIYDSAEFWYQEKGAYGRVVLYPSETHVRAVAKIHTFEQMQRDSSSHYREERISSLREKFPK